MWVEVAGSVLLGGIVLWLVLQPLYRPAATAPAFEEPEDPEETRRGIALIALKEIDFDRATGKLSDADYEMLKEKYTAEALAAIREDAPAAAPAPGVEASLRCHRCGTPPEPGASYCTACGGSLHASACRACHLPIEAESRFCPGCGAPAPA